jgi:hypothetical protein
VIRISATGPRWILNIGSGTPFFVDETLTIWEAAISATKILWGQIIIVLPTVLATTWVATQ